MKTIFHIQSDRQNKEHQTLLFEVGADHCSYALMDDAGTFTTLRYVGLDEWEGEESLPRILDEIENRSFSRVVVCSALPQAQLTPLKFSQSAAALVELTYEEPAQDYFSESVAEWQTVTAFSLPDWMTQAFRKRYAKLQFIHAYTVSLKKANQFEAENYISIHFTQRQFRVFVKRGGTVQLAQVYSYKTPLDVVYYLLKIVSELELDQSEVSLFLSGFVDEQSALYKELLKYFVQVRFADIPAGVLPENDYPMHYFSSIHNLATCVS